ncbi:Hypothetical protein PBC10988_33280 [Planctomycetales bacterium 10988]|nr:Hypothetical protein PBC10988_33280 [Planctomycetales bacterium 10988]
MKETTKLQTSRRIPKLLPFAFIIICCASIGSPSILMAAPPEENPYRPPAGNSIQGYLDHYQVLLEKPEILKSRSAFRWGLAATLEKILEHGDELEDTKQETFQNLQLKTLRDLAEAKDEEAEKELFRLARTYEKSPFQSVRQEAQLLLWEERLRAIEEPDQATLPELLIDLKKFLDTLPELGERHLEVASHSVRLINALEDEEFAPAFYGVYGELYAKSEYRALKAYGERLQTFGKKFEASLQSE